MTTTLARAVASLEERIYLADVIVVARLVSADADTLTFSAVEYLKGAGAAEFTVRASTVGRDTQYDNRDAVLFLAAPDGQARSGKSAASFDFADTTNFDYGGDSREVTHYTGDRPEGYAFDARNPVWLPAESVGRGTRDAGTTSFIADPGSSVTLSDLRATIAWVEGGAGVPGYDLCILGALDEIRYSRDWETYHGTPFTKEPFHIALDSGLPRGEEFTDYGTHGWPGYDRVWLTGPDADLFVAQNIDDDADPTNGFRNAVLTARPLPGATYRVRDHGQASVYEPCNFIATFNYVDYVVTVTPPAGYSTRGVLRSGGYQQCRRGRRRRNGVLEPAAFTVGGASATITGLEWEGRRRHHDAQPRRVAGGACLGLHRRSTAPCRSHCRSTTPRRAGAR